MKPHSENGSLNLSSAGGCVKPALPYLASIRSVDFQAPLHKPANFNEFATLILDNNAVGISRTTDATVDDIVVPYA
jgi:hypothetical protein